MKRLGHWARVGALGPLRWGAGIALRAVLGVLAVAVAGRADAQAERGQSASPVNTAFVIDDDAGQRVTLPHAPLRIASLAPSATEMLFAAGAGDRLVATVAFSDEPAAAKQVPRIGDVTAVDIERLVALHPDVVVVWPGGGNPAQIQKIAQLGFPVYRQQVNRLSDLPVSLRRLGALAPDRSVADAAARKLEESLARLAHEYGGGKHPTVLLQIWNRPIYTVGGTQLMSDALTLCGARNVFGDLKELSPVISTEAVIARNPDMIVAVAPPGEARGWLDEWQRFGSLKAVRDGRLIPFEDQRFVRLGPSFVAATGEFCKALVSRESY